MEKLNKKEQDQIIQESKLDKEDILYTFEDYISGKILNLFSYQLKMIVAGMTAKHDVLVAKHGKFKYNISKEDNTYFFHIIIPSESVSKISFDVVIQLTAPDDKEKDLNKYYMKMYSNSPSFTFTFAYAINDANMLADGTVDKIDKQVLEIPPTVKNPGLMLGFDKFIYMACVFLRDNDMLDANKLDKIYKTKFVPYNKILKAIPDDETKLKEYKLKKKSMTDSEKTLKRKAAVRDNRTRTTSASTLKVRSKKHENEIKSKEEHTQKVKNAKASGNQKFKDKTKSVIKGKKLKPKRKIGR